MTYQFTKGKIIENHENVPTLFFKMTFRQEKIDFFDGIFFKVHLEIQENRLGAVPERIRQCRPSVYGRIRKYTKSHQK